MAFQPEVNEELVIDGVSYRIGEHPVARGMPYGQEGRAAVVYLLVHGDDQDLSQRRALKVFKPRFREPGLVALSTRLASYAGIPGLSVCKRTVLTPQYNAPIIRENPDLIYAVVMPWIDGPTWMEVLLDERELTPQQSLSLAHSLCSILNEMEKQGLAHCDLSGPNVLIPMLAHQPDSGQSPVALVDVEQMYGPELKRPSAIPAGSSGYAHKTSPEGVWASNADRFSGAVLLSEMLGWCDERVRKASWGENYFDPDEMQQPGDRYETLRSVLRERWGDGVASLFENAWLSDTLNDCPTFAEWQAALSRGPYAASQPTIFVPLAPDVYPLEDIPVPAEPPPAVTTGGRPPRAGTPWAILIPAAVILIALLAGGFALFQAQASGSRANATATAQALSALAATQTAGAHPNTTATVIALATRYPGAISPLTISQIKLLGVLQGHTGPVLSVAVSADGIMLASASADRTVRIWKLSNGETLHVLTGHSGPVTSVSFSPDSKTLVSGSTDRTARLWNTNDGSPLRSLNFGAALQSIIYAYEQDLIAISSMNSVQVWSPTGNAPIASYNGPGLVRKARFAPDDQTIASGAQDGTLRIWRIGDNTFSHVLNDQTAAINDVAFSLSGLLFATGSDDFAVRVYHFADTAAGSGLPTNVHLVSFAADSQGLIYTLKGHTSPVTSVAFSPDGQILASGGADNSVRLWNMHDGSLMLTLKAAAAINSIAFSPDGTELIAACQDGTVLIWGTDAATLEPSPIPRTAATGTPTFTFTPVPTPSVTVNAVPTSTNTLSPTATPTRAATLAATRQPTRTATRIAPTATRTRTPLLPTRTATTAATATRTPVPHTATRTPAPTFTLTRVPPTHTATPTGTATATRTNTATPTSTPTNTRQPTDTPVPTRTPTYTRVPTDTPTRIPIRTPTETPVPIPCQIVRFSASAGGCSLTVTWSYSGACADRGVLIGLVRGQQSPYLTDRGITPNSSPYHDDGPGQCGECTIIYRLTLYNQDGSAVNASTSVTNYNCIP